jgi:hypothetical protein
MLDCRSTFMAIPSEVGAKAHRAENKWPARARLDIQKQSQSKNAHATIKNLQRFTMKCVSIRWESDILSCSHARARTGFSNRWFAGAHSAGKSWFSRPFGRGSTRACRNCTGQRQEGDAMNLNGAFVSTEGRRHRWVENANRHRNYMHLRVWMRIERAPLSNNKIVWNSNPSSYELVRKLLKNKRLHGLFL